MDQIDFEMDINENDLDKYTTDELDHEPEKICHELEKTKDGTSKALQAITTYAIEGNSSKNEEKQT